MPRQHAQVFERKWELGVVFEAQLKDGGGAATPYEMFRAAVGEFIGTLLFLFSGEKGGKARRDRTNKTNREKNERTSFFFLFFLQVNLASPRNLGWVREENACAEPRSAALVPTPTCRAGRPGQSGSRGGLVRRSPRIHVASYEYEPPKLICLVVILCPPPHATLYDPDQYISHSVRKCKERLVYI